MRIRIQFDNKRQYRRYRFIQLFSGISGFFILILDASLNNESVREIGVLYCIFSIIWSLEWGKIILSLFEKDENDYKRFRNVFILLTLLIVVITYFSVNNYLLKGLCYFNLVWGLGIVKKIVSLFDK
jgi:hypothetical protein